MKERIVQKCFALLLTLACSSGHAAQEMSSQDAPNLGEIYQFSSTDTQVGLINNSDRAITVTGIVDPANGLTLKHPIEVPPHQVQSVPVEVNVANRLGVAHLDAKLTTTPALADPVVIAVSAFVNSVLEEPRPVIDFGVVEFGAVKTEIFRPVSEQPEPVRIVKIESVGDGFDARIVEDGKALSVTTAPNAGWGTHLEFAKVKTNSTLQREIWVRLKANVHGAVIASVDPVDFSLVRQGSGAEEVVLLEAKSQAAIDVESVQIEGARFSHALEACPQRAGCLRLKLKLDDGQPIGQIFGKAWVKFKNENSRLPINIRGLVISKDQRIVELPPRVTSGGDSNSLTKSNLVEEIKAATTETVAAPVPTTPPGKGPLLKWSVTHEEGDLHGYIVYRSDEKDGRFVRINDSIIKTLGSGSREAVDYQWRDNSATSGKSYWYYVGLIYNDGHKGKLTEPQKVVAK